MDYAAENMCFQALRIMLEKWLDLPDQMKKICNLYSIPKSRVYQLSYSDLQLTVHQLLSLEDLDFQGPSLVSIGINHMPLVQLINFYRLHG